MTLHPQPFKMRLLTKKPLIRAALVLNQLSLVEADILTSLDGRYKHQKLWRTPAAKELKSP